MHLHINLNIASDSNNEVGVYAHNSSEARVAHLLFKVYVCEGHPVWRRLGWRKVALKWKKVKQFVQI